MHVMSTRKLSLPFVSDDSDQCTDVSTSANKKILFAEKKRKFPLIGGGAFRKVSPPLQMPRLRNSD